MTHIFLTGDIGIGKSTVIKKTLTLLKPLIDGRPDGVKKSHFGGFNTYFGPDRSNPDRCLYMNDAPYPPVYDDRHAVARFRQGSAEAIPGRFDALGVKYISEARKNARLIIMDECGGLEKDAQAFLCALEDSTPVLGIIKRSASGWAERLRSRKNVRLMTVDAENRDMLPFLLAEIYAPLLQ